MTAFTYVILNHFKILLTKGSLSDICNSAQLYNS